MTPIEVNLRRFRERKGLTQAELGKLARVRQATVSNLENGKGRRVDLDVLERVARALGVKATDLLTETKSRR
jgi:transcriptional regulator with XRE-family HTH domain